jgi:hypothetical protein
MIGSRRPVKGVRSSVDEDLGALISEYGWAVRHVGGTEQEAPFSYTVGLSTLGLPEIVTTGLPFASSHEFLNMVALETRDGLAVTHGARSTRFTDSGDIAFIRVEDTRGLTAVQDRYGEVVALQLIWPDSTGAYPWDAGYRNPPDAQPLLGRVPIEFKLV